MNAMLEKQIDDMRGRNDVMQSQVENSLSQSHENMSKVLQDNRKLEASKDLLMERTEKLRLA